MNKLTPNPENISADNFEQVARSTADGKLHHRLLAIRALLKGFAPELIADMMNVSIRTLYSWVKRWNESGIDDLPDKLKSGRRTKLTAEMRSRVIELIDNPQLANQYHWTAVKLHGFLKENESIELGYSSLTRLLHNEGYALKVPRSWPVDQDEAQRKAFVINMNNLLEKQDVEVWFGDESGFLADPRPRRIWAKKGTTPTTPATGLHVRESVVGAVCPRTGEMTSLVVDGMDTIVFQVFIDVFAAQTAGRKIVLVMDNASWHKSKSLNWYHITPMYLPAYSPDLNPIERLWRVIKERFFTQWYTKDKTVLIERICDTLRSFMDNPQIIKSLCAV